MYNNNLLTKINNDDIIKDSRGNIIRVGNKEYGYNNRGLIESYTKGEERYKYYYNYLGQRNKKERYKKEENEWKLKESKEYYLDEGIIIEESSGEEKLKYYYDKDGVSGIRYKGKNYELIRDILNNVREVVLNGKVIGEYLYDGWGNVEVRLTQGITKEEQYVIENNPYRYRGYYYDKESGLYYCSSRYYSPELCIFTSIDSIEYLDCESINGLDLYCYCLNNPINIVYSGASIGGSSSEVMINSVALNSINNGSHLDGSNSFGRSVFLGNLISGVSAVHGVIDSVSSYLAGSVDGLISYIDIPKLNGFQGKLNKYSNWLMGIGIGLDIASSTYNNYMNPNLTTGQKWASFGSDVGYIAAKSGLSYLAGSLVTKGSVALGSAVACSLVGASIGGLTIGFGGAILIGGGVVVLGIVAGTILIAVVSDALDNWWEKKKEEWFN